MPHPRDASSELGTGFILDLGPIRAKLCNEIGLLDRRRVVNGRDLDSELLNRSVFELPGLLRFELVQLPLLPIDFCLLRRYPPLHFFVLLLPSLHLVTDYGSAE